jgi:hypothetical protein
MHGIVHNMRQLVMVLLALVLVLLIFECSI